MASGRSLPTKSKCEWPAKLSLSVKSDTQNRRNRFAPSVMHHSRSKDAARRDLELGASQHINSWTFASFKPATSYGNRPRQCRNQRQHARHNFANGGAWQCTREDLPIVPDARQISPSAHEVHLLSEGVSRDMGLDVAALEPQPTCVTDINDKHSHSLRRTMPERMQNHDEISRFNMGWLVIVLTQSVKATANRQIDEWKPVGSETSATICELATLRQPRRPRIWNKSGISGLADKLQRTPRTCVGLRFRNSAESSMHNTTAPPCNDCWLLPQNPLSYCCCKSSAQCARLSRFARLDGCGMQRQNASCALTRRVEQHNSRLMTSASCHPTLRRNPRAHGNCSPPPTVGLWPLLQ